LGSTSSTHHRLLDVHGILEAAAATDAGDDATLLRPQGGGTGLKPDQVDVAITLKSRDPKLV